jgi:hypothetical protein
MEDLIERHSLYTVYDYEDHTALESGFSPADGFIDIDLPGVGMDGHFYRTARSLCPNIRVGHILAVEDTARLFGVETAGKGEITHLFFDRTGDQVANGEAFFKDIKEDVGQRFNFRTGTNDFAFDRKIKHETPLVFALNCNV